MHVARQPRDTRQRVTSAPVSQCDHARCVGLEPVRAYRLRVLVLTQRPQLDRGPRSHVLDRHVAPAQHLAVGHDVTGDVDNLQRLRKDTRYSVMLLSLMALA